MEEEYLCTRKEMFSNSTLSSLSTCLTPERFPSNQPPLNIHPGYIPIISTEQETFQKRIKRRFHRLRTLRIHAPQTRITSIVTEIDHQRIKALPGRKRAYLLINIAHLGTTQSGEIEQGCNRKLPASELGLREIVCGLPGLHGYDLGCHTRVLDHGKDRG
jgi:hypothetical protein